MVSSVERLSETALLIAPGDSLVANNVAGFKHELEELASTTKRHRERRELLRRELLRAKLCRTSRERTASKQE